MTASVPYRAYLLRHRSLSASVPYRAYRLRNRSMSASVPYRANLLRHRSLSASAPYSTYLLRHHTLSALCIRSLPCLPTAALFSVCICSFPCLPTAAPFYVCTLHPFLTVLTYCGTILCLHSASVPYRAYLLRHRSLSALCIRSLSCLPTAAPFSVCTLHPFLTVLTYCGTVLCLHPLLAVRQLRHLDQLVLLFEQLLHALHKVRHFPKLRHSYKNKKKCRISEFMNR